MKYLIDTHILIWFLEGDKQLSTEISALIENSQNEVYISQASLWEMAIKIGIGKLRLSISLSELEQFLMGHQFQILPINFPHYEELQNLAFHHQDPFDRMIIAQAKVENLILITHDRRFQMYDVNLF
ncbi:MAG TPA: type II toxin-antitoxin system VapC family toxin [Oscillatoriales cyanobacterium M59_W2019_021]|nr:type II toxin-antitoxin system VapC family toxin [Oscillatoriales cyanobacterium M59_W2019_021]